MLRSITFLSAMIAMVAALSVEVNIKGPERGACKGVITFIALDSDCGDCLYGVKDFRYATVKCKTQAAAEQCCKTVTKSCFETVENAEPKPMNACFQSSI
ncbi:hypothetical protein HMPREF1544_07839 [Mucor circinelloides 1006PhL]|uniref:Uncharacterized protein n=1 Tax=Mucor circinelloides f. circinelloides (strain 1006PhL) TaxID=1220926 RepID=S2J6X9_MUCC1|nr:hypothetical protein HMPREF1544_07839 [Mucor circinelloides 1006PhL]KAG1113370.1 hypothetical protein G6F42_014483 [Rhizopus arrhizus]